MGNIERSEAERWLAWLDSDRNNDGDVPLKGTPYQAAQRVAKRLHDQRGAVEENERLRDALSDLLDGDDHNMREYRASARTLLDTPTGGQYEAE